MQTDELLLWAQFPFFLATVLWLVRPGRIRRALRALRELPRAGWFLLLATVLPVSLVLTAMDGFFTHLVGHDFAQDLARLEGEVIPHAQAWTPAAFVALCALVYTMGFPALIASATAEALAEASVRPLRILAIGLAANYVLALPFYFFVPVSEVHAVHPDVRYLLHEASPVVEASNRHASGIDNCFPSLHTSITVTMLLSFPLLRKRSVLLGGFVVFTTLYLGIHWFVDVAAGIVLGVVCHLLAARLAGAPARRPVAALRPAPREIGSVAAPGELAD